MAKGRVAGVDEAGRGPWAGPVVAACVILKPAAQHIEGINDSKKLTPERRKELYELIKENAIYGIGMATCGEIDRLGIKKATELAIKRAIDNMPEKPDFLLVDGKDKFELPVKYHSIVDGDEKVKSIAAASILAKVWRDEYMKLMGDMYPLYGFEKHKGYGTKKHREALEKYGITPIHRESFKPVQEIKKKISEKPRLLLHACCAPCATGVIERLKERYSIEVFFYNPNIQPGREYRLRLKEIEKLCRHHNIKLHTGEYDTRRWFRITRRYRHDREGSKRCYLCYGMRMYETAKLAKKIGADAFSTTLSVSPLKKYPWIKKIGTVLSGAMDIKFDDTDFKKRDGFKLSSRLAREFGFYRQNYCGCVYSFKEMLQKKGDTDERKADKPADRQIRLFP